MGLGLILSLIIPFVTESASFDQMRFGFDQLFVNKKRLVLQFRRDRRRGSCSPFSSFYWDFNRFVECFELLFTRVTLYATAIGGMGQWKRKEKGGNQKGKRGQ